MFSGHPDRAYPAGQAATERLCRTLQPNRALRLACANPIRLDRASAGHGHPLAMDLQPRAPEHGTRWHHADAEIGARRLTPLLLSVKSGGITLPPLAWAALRAGHTQAELGRGSCDVLRRHGGASLTACEVDHCHGARRVRAMCRRWQPQPEVES